MKRVLVTFVLLCAAFAQAFAQVPYFPQTLPGSTVVGRISANPGATEAVPFTALVPALRPLIFLSVLPTIACTPCFWSSTGVIKMDRLLVGEAALGGYGAPPSPKDWLENTIAATVQNAQLASVNSLGLIGIAGGSRTSDYRIWGGSSSFGTIGVAGYGVNDDAGANNATAWAGYFEAQRTTTSGTAWGLETGVGNFGDLVVTDPYNLFPLGYHASLVVESGIGRPASWDTRTPVTAAEGIRIVNNGAKFYKGILYGATALDTSLGNGGGGIAIEMASGQEFRWLSAAATPAVELWGNTGGVQIKTAAGVAQQLQLLSADATLYSSINFNNAARVLQLGLGGAAESAIGVANKFFLWDQAASKLRFTIDTSGNLALYNGGGFQLNGSSSGIVSIIPISGSAGNPTLTLPNTTGTFAVNVTSPLSLSATTGLVSWSTTINQILYSSASNTVTGLATANTAALVTSSAGVPSLTSGSTANRVLRTDGTTVSFAQVALATDVSGQAALTNGGTNASLTASNGGIFYSTASAGAILSGTSTARQMLQSGSSTTPAWSTTTWPATTTSGQLLYSSSASVIGEVTKANTSLLVTDGSGVPSWSVTPTVQSATSFSPQITVFNTANDSSGPYFILQKGRGASTASQVNDTAGTFLFKGLDTNGATQTAAYMQGTITTVGVGAVTADFQFVTGNGSFTFTFGHTGLFTAPAGLGVGTTSDPGAGLIYLNAASFLMRNKTSWTNGAAAATGTLTNAPSAGNPTKWIPIDDNGTTRYVPAW